MTKAKKAAMERRLSIKKVEEKARQTWVICDATVGRKKKARELQHQEAAMDSPSTTKIRGWHR